ncbi:MAG: hypothetical protein JW867_00575 [Candidatus Omnitrophica bacterium]|nr:hypothetical protein [Candidatus Omnitrophota bacterium]
MKKIFFYLLILSFLIGCSPRETARVLGIGVSPFKTSGKIHSKVVDKDIFTAYRDTERLLRDLTATPYRGSASKGFMVVRDFSFSYGGRCPDSTEVAVFFEEVDATKTQIQVSSLNYGLSDFVAEKIFEGVQ